MTGRVAITGIGVVSSLGIGWREFWGNLIAGKSGISPVASFDTSNHFTHFGGEAKNFKPEQFISAERMAGMNRATQMAVAAAKLAVRDTGLSQEDFNRSCVGVSHGTTLGAAQAIEEVDALLVANKEVRRELFQQMPVHAAPAAIAREFNCAGPNFMVSTACAAGNYAVAYGYDLIRMGKADIVLAGASDGFSRIEFTGFNQFKAVAPEKCQPFDKNRKGMMTAEGAGILVLESLEAAVKRNAPLYAEILGYGLSCDAFHMTTANVNGIAECMRKALKETRLSAEAVDYISAHGTGTPSNDKNECAAVKEVFGHRSKSIPISSIKSMLGHTMGAASAIEALACALVVKNDVIPPTINFETPDPECDVYCVPNEAKKHVVNVALNNSYAFGGNNACLVLSKYRFS